MRSTTSTPSRKTRVAIIAVLAVLAVVLVAITAGAVAAAQFPPARDAADAGGVVATTDPEQVANEQVADEQVADEQVALEQGVVWRTVDGEVLTLDAYVPASTGEARAVVLLIHGGGWSSGDKADFAAQAQALAEAGYVAITVEYRLAPEHPFPAALEDVEAAVAWLRADAQVRHYGIDPARVGVLGGSAGGQLAEMLGAVGTGATDSGTRVAAVVSWSGVSDFTSLDIDATALGCVPADCPDVAADASPRTHVDATDAPMLLVTSADDPIVPASQSEAMADALAAVGVDHELLVLDGAGHAYQLDAVAWAATVAFLDEHLPSGAAA